MACRSSNTNGSGSTEVAPNEVGGPSTGDVIAGAGDPAGSAAAVDGASAADQEMVGSPVEPMAGGVSENAGSSEGPLPTELAGSPEEAASSDDLTPSDEAASEDETRIALFDGSNLDAWISRNTGGPAGWQVVGDGTMVVTPGAGDIITRQAFEDVFVHVEYKTPAFPANVTGQARGNSGVYLQGMYEMQVLDSFGRPPEIDGCGAVYGVRPPLTVACFQEEVWNTYEIEFQAPRYDAQGNKLSNARMVLVTLNGVVVQENTEVPAATPAGLAEAQGPAGLMLQDHGNLVAFRNIWVIPR
jgi:hypothetical protein